MNRTKISKSLWSIIVICFVFGVVFFSYQPLSGFNRTSSQLLIDSNTIKSIDDLDKTRILVDISHGWEVFIPGKVSPMGAILEATGKYEVVPLFMQEINDSVLADIDILMIITPDPNVPYTTSEISAVSNFWKSGGRILFSGSFQGVGFELYRPNSEINRIVSNLGFNITFDEDRTVHARGLNTNSLPDHPLTYGITSTYFYDGCPIDIGNEPEAEVISERKGNPNYVAWSNSSHRAVFLGGVDPLFEFNSRTLMHDPNALNYTHHYQFQLNIFHWLSSRAPEAIEDYRPIKMYTGLQNSISEAELRQLPYFKGVCHFHTETSLIALTNDQIAARSVELGYQFIVVTDYNAVAGGPAFNQTITSGKYTVKNRLIQIINGVEVTGLGQYHTTGWGLTEDIAGVLNPVERIELFHAQGSPCILAHPSWLISPDYPRIWDPTLYSFDGYEIINSGFIQGSGNLVYTGKPWYGGPDDSGATWNKTWMYVFTEDISSDPKWWTEAFNKSRIVIYNPKDDVYAGDQLLLDELLARFEDETAPRISLNSSDNFSPEEDVIVDVIVDDVSPTVVTLTVNGVSKGKMDPDLTVVGRFSKNLGTFDSGTTLQLSVKAEDDKGFQTTQVFTVTIGEDSTTASTTIATSTPSLTWLSVIPLILVIKFRTKKRK